MTIRRAEQEEDTARRVRAAEEAQGLATRRLEEQKALEAKARQAVRHSEARQAQHAPNKEEWPP